MDQARATKRFSELHERESDAIFRFCVLRVSRREVALDLTQDTFIRFWDKIARGEEIKNERAFLFTIARNLIIDWYRKEKPYSLDALEEPNENEGSFGRQLAFEESTSEAETEAGLILKLINELDRQYREVVYMRFVEELKPREIGEIIGESPNVVSVRINRGLKALRLLMHHEKQS